MPGPPRDVDTDLERNGDDHDGLAGGRPSPGAGAPPARGSDLLTAILPSGRVSWLRITPTLAPVQEANHLADAIERMEHRRGERLRSLDEALRRTSRTLPADVARVSTDHRRRHRELRRRILSGDAKVGRRASAVIAELRGALRKQLEREGEMARRLSRRALWDHLVVASAFPLFAAFGKRGNPLAEDNVALALLLLVWLVGDEITDVLSGDRRDAEDGVRKLDLWSYLAPVANLLTGWLLMHNRQHERFVTGFTSLGPPRPLPEGTYLYDRLVDLAPFLGPEHVPDFVTYSGVPAVAGVVALAPPEDPTVAAQAHVRTITASVDRGVLNVSVSVAVEPPETPLPDVRALVPSVNVAWIVDTKEP